MNRKERRASIRCRNCCRPGLSWAPYCARCIEDTRERYRCPDCDSTVTVAVAEGVPGMFVDLRHDSTCPTWRAKQAL
jgi:hypothetical protein